MKSIILVFGLTLLSLSFVSCGSEEEFVPQPNDRSTIITGRICTPEGTPLAGIPVSVNYMKTSYPFDVIRHKADGITDKDGYYRVFFNVGINEEESMVKGYRFSVDLTDVAKELYLIPFSDDKLDCGFVGANKISQTLTFNVTIPRRKDAQITITNPGSHDGEEGEYAIAHTFSYGDDWWWIKASTHAVDPSFLTVYKLISIPNSGSITMSFPCAIGVSNKFQLVYRESRIYDFEPVSDAQIIDITDSSNDRVELIFSNEN